MPQDIVDLDTQNKLTVPAGELTPFPLTQNDKPVDASKIEVPTQEPVATLGVMLGKAVKLAAGHLDTHSRKSVMDKTFVRQMLNEACCQADLEDITLARELWEKIPAGKRPDFVKVVISHCTEHCKPLLPNGLLTILLIDDEGHIYTTA